MKRLYSVKVLKTSVLIFALSCIASLVTFAQSETNNPVTYDTTITEKANGEGPVTWNVRITRQKTDNSQRPAIFFIPGAGEVGTNTASMTTYGPHYWLLNGWDGGVKLGNGTHYPVIVTIQQPSANMRPWHTKAVLDALLAALPIKRSSVHVTGLSEGSYEWGELISYAASSGDQTSMTEIKSWVNLEGVGPGDNFSGFDQAYPAVFGTWASKYGGRFLGLEGTQDSRNIWQISQAMNSAVANSAYFSYENIGGGAHCCWNSMYDPSVTNWRCTAPVSNANIVPSTNPASTIGNYYVAPTGTNLFQWMLRQGDTSMVGSTGTPTPVAPTVSAGSGQSIALPTTSATLSGTATAASGTTIMSNTWTQTAGPATSTIASPSSLTTSVSGLSTAGTYSFALTSKNNAGQTASAPVTVTVAAQTPAAGQAPKISFVNPAISMTLPTNSCVMQANVTVASGTTLSSVRWHTLSGPNVPGVVNPNNGSTTVQGLIVGTYTFSLTATDSKGTTGTGQMTITVNPAVVKAPVVTFTNPSLSITLPISSVLLQANVAVASGTTLSSVRWKTLSAPLTPGVVNPNNGTTTVVGLIAGTYTFQLTATDSKGNTGTGQLTVTVLPGLVVTIQPPTVTVASSSSSITLPTSSVTLTGTPTLYGGATLSSVQWKTISAPTTPGVVSPTSATTSVVGLIAGIYTFQLTATDSKGNSGSAQVTVTVNPAAVVTSPPPVTGSSTLKTFVAPGEYEVFFIDQNKHLYAVGTNIRTLGVGNTGVGGTTLPVAVPSNLTFQTAASGLHNGAAVDMNGNVWTWGDNSQGQTGNGTTSTTETMSPYQITTDVNGNTFTGVTALTSFYTGNVANGWYAIKSDGSLWIWGQTLGGMQGNGQEGSTTVSRPMQIPVPGGRKAQQVSSGNMTILLCTDGTVWTCGNEGGNAQDLGYAATGTNYSTFHQLTGLSGITQVAGGGSFNYALKSDGTLYGWGYYGFYLGGTSGVNNPVATPTVLNSQLNLRTPIKTIVTDMVSTHVILTDGTLWGWGDNAQGNIGNGHELNYATSTYPYAWDWNPGDLLQQMPVQVTTRNDFVGLFSTWSYVMYTYAETSSGQLYSWGRNKGGVLGNGIVGCSSVAATYPNSWDVTTATAVNPLAITTATVVPSPWCITHPTTAPCNQCAITNTQATSADTANTGLTNTVTNGLSLDPAVTATTEQFIVYPSVTTGVLNLRVSSETSGPVQISIYDLNGRVVQSEKTSKQDQYLEQSFNVAKLPAGMYMVQVLIGDNKRLVTKFIKQ